MLLPQSQGGSSTAGADRVTAVKSGVALVSTYGTRIQTGAVNWGGAAGNTSKEWLTRNHDHRIRQAGDVTQVKLYLANTTNLTALYIKIWRINSSGTFDLVGTSNDILADITAATTSTVTLSSAITGVNEGDWIGYRAEWSDGVQNFVAATGTTTVTGCGGGTNVNNGSLSVINTTPSATGYAWKAQTFTSGTTFPIECYMSKPMIVFEGDSMTRGAVIHEGYVRDCTWAADNINDRPEHTFAHMIGKKLNYTYQNMGDGGDTSTQVAALIAADVVALDPRYLFLMVGTNDINASISLTTFLSNMTTIFDACKANSIKCIYTLIPPRGAYSNAQNQEVDRFNRRVSELASFYPEDVSIVDMRPDIGLFRVAGDEGNLWDIQTAYDYGDNVHLSTDGNRVVAEAVLRDAWYWSRTL